MHANVRVIGDESTCDSSNDAIELYDSRASCSTPETDTQLSGAQSNCALVKFDATIMNEEATRFLYECMIH